MPNPSDATRDEGENVTVRGFVKLRRRIKALGDEIQTIRNKGLAAVTSETERTVFKGMLTVIGKRREQLEAAWDAAVDYAEEHSLTFPSTTDTSYLNQTTLHYYEALGFGENVFAKSAGASDTTFNASSPNMSCIQGSKPRAILPKINIKTFKGDISCWPTFKQMYDALISQDPHLTNAERFHYLVSFLEGPALDTIKHIPVLDVNYNQAWEALCKVYDNQRKLACNYLDRLLNFKPHHTKADADSLQRYLSNVTETVASLQNLKIPNFEEYLLCELALRGLDPHTRQAFEFSISSTLFPRFTTLRDFIQDRCHALRMTEEFTKSSSKFPSSTPQHLKSNRFAPNNFSPKSTSQAMLTTEVAHASSVSDKQPAFSCYVCKKPHTIIQCTTFKQGTPSQRLDLLKRFPGCRNCLNVNHKTQFCKSTFTCRDCKGRHHTLLHLPTCDVKPTNSPVSQDRPVLESPMAGTSSSFVGSNTSGYPQSVLLGTVTAQLLDTKGHPHIFRGVLDNGSQWSFITQDCAKKLGKFTKPFSGVISGINSIHLKNLSGKVSISFVCNSSINLLETEAIVTPTITPPLPQEPLQSTMWQDYSSYHLSDPDFTKPLPISFLIGADLYTDVVTGSPIVIYEHGPRLVKTVFGYTVMGRFAHDSASPGAVSLLSISDTARLIERFWAIEETIEIPSMSPEEKECEDHFIKQHRRDDSGRYIVSLPIKPSSSPIVPNINKAISRFYALESKFMKDHQLQLDYSQFMQEYLDLGHMSMAATAPSYVIPHHPVYKVDSEGNRKIRVVFDASFRTVSGSLNDHLYTGPKLQADISSIVLNFRRSKYVISCDLVKMYRQILVEPRDRTYQQIVWRFNPSAALTFFELNTITYGLRSSPFQAQRVLQQLALDEGHAFPAAAAILRDCTYVDDCIFGANSIEEIADIKLELVQLLAKGGFALSKWKSNYPPLLVNEITSDQPMLLCNEEGSSTKILGMIWNPTLDAFSYEVLKPPQVYTKRMILSCIARLFDPLGYLAPIVFVAKHILQESWKSKVEWDDVVPDHVKALWAQFIDDFASIAQILIPRALPINSPTYDLVCFCDASERGYCAVIYLRASFDDQPTMALLKAKTRLAPLKTLTIPRLELCAAVLLANMIKSLKPFLRHYLISNIFCFSDSTVVLAWLKTPPYQLMTFVSNRVTQVMDITQSSWWHHIKGVDNPADIGSRGCLPSALLRNNIWWHGPKWCCQPIPDWPITQHIEVVDLPELKPEKSMVLVTVNKHEEEFLKWIQRFSSFTKLIRTIAYIRRFYHNSRVPKCKKSQLHRNPVSSSEFIEAEYHCVKLVQRHYYSIVFDESPDKIPPELKCLSIFIDAAGLIRVGGRLANSPLSPEAKFPILLPAKSHLTNIIVDHVHQINNHPGPTALLAFLRQKYWIPRARNLIRLHKAKCVTCIRYSGTTLTPFMGNLPTSRFTAVRPFINCGVDFAGPFLCRTSTRRNSGTTKAYLCLFCCLASRAVHLELSTTLSVESFLDAFDRFTSRRGLPAHMYSDCGTNFVGTANYLKEVYDWFSQLSNQDAIINHTAYQNVLWSFNPANSPHMGGSWESLIKCAKHLFYKVFGNQPFTQPELSTMFVKVEGILNSRPLQPLSDSPDDPEALTPGHFLIGQPINCLPEPDFSDIPSNRLNRWQLLRERVQHFWSRWKTEYLTSLQVRTKWLKKSPNLRVGNIVLLKDAKTSPTYWPLARIIATHPGSDSVVRVVTIKTSRGTYKRSIVNVIPLPVTHDH